MEKTLRLSGGVLGALKNGTELPQTAGGRARRPTPDWIHSEILASMMLREDLGPGTDSSLFRDELKRSCAEASVPQLAITNSELEKLRSAAADHLARWLALDVGQTIEIEVAGQDDGPMAMSRR